MWASGDGLPTPLTPPRPAWQNKSRESSMHRLVLRLVPKYEGVKVSNATVNNISVISWPSVLLTKETGENYRPSANHWQKVVSSAPSSWAGF
jgi:hypothetical protein